MRLATSVAAALAATVIAGCGSAGTDEEQVRDAYRAYARAFADGDGKQLCERLTAESREDLLAVASPGAADCPAVAAKLNTLVDDADVDIVREAAIVKLTVTGDRAVVEGAKGTDGADNTTRMRKVSGTWLVDLDANDTEGFGPL